MLANINKQNNYEVLWKKYDNLSTLRHKTVGKIIRFYEQYNNMIKYVIARRKIIIFSN